MMSASSSSVMAITLTDVRNGAADRSPCEGAEKQCDQLRSIDSERKNFTVERERRRWRMRGKLKRKEEMSKSK